MFSELFLSYWKINNENLVWKCNLGFLAFKAYVSFSGIATWLLHSVSFFACRYVNLKTWHSWSSKLNYQLRFSLPWVIIMAAANQSWKKKNMETNKMYRNLNWQTWPFDPFEVNCKWLTAAKDVTVDLARVRVAWHVIERRCNFLLAFIALVLILETQQVNETY